MDPRIAEIMAKMNNTALNGTGDAAEENKDATEGTEQNNAKKVKPPLNYDEFIKAEKLNEWPMRLTSENLLDLSEERDLLGKPDDVVKQLKEATPVDMQMLRDLEKRLAQFDSTLTGFSDMILASSDEVATQLTKDNFPLSVNRAFLTDMNESDAVKTHPSRKRKAMDFKDKVLESQKKNVEHCDFPGFRHGELTELPGSLEAPQILHRVTKAQDFNPGFRKFWKKIFQSEASTALMQDTFWWIFIELFQKDKKGIIKEQSRLFDRLADSFVALFTSVNPDIKDKVFSVYSDCLAQSMFAAFWEAFPESERYFGDTFKQFLCNICTEWISGMKAAPGAWQKWDIKRLESKTIRPADIGPTPSHTDANKEAGSHDLGIEDCMRTIERLGHHSAGSRGEAASQTAMPVTREPTRMTLDTMRALPPVHAKKTFESSVMGRGAEMERSLFNLQGRSPLVAHYLHMRQLRHNANNGKKVRRTEIVKLPPSDQPTYRELIDETMATSKTLSTEYQKVCDMTSAEILRIEKNQRETNRKIEKLQKELLFCKNSLEVKIMSERLLGKQESQDTPRLAIKDTEEEEEYI